MAHKYEVALRKTVEDLYYEDSSNVTVKSVRSTVEKKLGLNEGFFKQDVEWKERSKNIVNDTFVSKVVRISGLIP